MKRVIEISEEQFKYLKKRIELGMALEMDKIVWNGRPLEDYLFPFKDKHIDEWLEGARKNGQFISEHMKRNCTDCILDGTDACSRGAVRAVDSEVCKDFLRENENA